MKLADKTYLINLEYRIDRLRMAKQQLEKAEIEYTLFPAIDSKKMGIKGTTIENQGLIGCFLSHFFILQEAVMNGYKSIAVFEDDIIFVSDFKNKFEKYMGSIPEKWQLFMLGYYERLENGHKTMISENIVIPHSTWGTHGYIVRNEGIKIMWENLKTIHTHIDVQISNKIISKLYTYCAYPALVHQIGVKSDIQNA